MIESAPATSSAEPFNWILMVKLRSGHEAEGRRICTSMGEQASRREGVTNYRWYESDGDVHFQEAFADSAAGARHIRAFTDNWAETFLSAVEPLALHVYGNPSSEVRNLLSGFAPRYLSPGTTT